MVPRYRARKRPGALRIAWRLLWRAAAVLLLALVAVVAGLRVLEPPTTAFMLGARLDAWRSGAPQTLEHHWVDAACLPDSVRLAVLAAEDQKFASHGGFDMAEIADALAAARQGQPLRGASTISQQTAKNLFLWSAQSWLRKGLEAALTVLIEALWPKRRILEVYLNVVELGPGIYGMEAAAQRFFGKPALRLTRAESALLAAALPNPGRFDVAAPSVYLRERQRRILGQMSEVARLPGVAALLNEGDRSHEGAFAGSSPGCGR